MNDRPTPTQTQVAVEESSVDITTLRKEREMQDREFAFGSVLVRKMVQFNASRVVFGRYTITQTRKVRLGESERESVMAADGHRKREKIMLAIAPAVARASRIPEWKIKGTITNVPWRTGAGSDFALMVRLRRWIDTAGDDALFAKLYVETLDVS